jgi:hypothetical protein
VRGIVLLAALALAASASPASAPAALYTLRDPPTASFTWLPRLPHTGEAVSFISTSTDFTSPLTGFAWDLSDNGPFGPFVPGGPAVTTTFSTPAEHVVRLRVTARDGLSGAVAETVRMSPPPPGVMTPFPTVRIVGRDTRKGVRVRLLAVRAPREARIAITCRGRSCPLKTIRAVAHGGRSRTASVRFHQLERFLPAPMVLELRISKAGEVGGYTRYQIRRGRLPLRRDSCLAAGGLAPIPCPTG